MTNLERIHTLDIGNQFAALSACTIQNYLFIGNADGIHIFNMNSNFKREAGGDIEEGLTAMSELETFDVESATYIVCGTEEGKVFFFRANYDDTKTLIEEFMSAFKNAVDIRSGWVYSIE